MQVDVNSYHDIGDYLREVRESHGFDVRNIAHQLNIRAKYLVALEEGKIDVMPGKVYARGYLQHYAEFLGLDKEEIAEAFDRMGNGSHSKVRYFVPEPTSRNYQPGMLVVGLALAVVVVAYYFWYKNHGTPAPRDYEMVSPVPERLLDPIIEEPEVQENDDSYVEPLVPQTGNQQGDNNLILQQPVIPEATTSPEAAPMSVPPVKQEDSNSKLEQSQRQKMSRKLPWLQNPEMN